jgi:hypothetical protein
MEENKFWEENCNSDDYAIEFIKARNTSLCEFIGEFCDEEFRSFLDARFQANEEH